MIINMTERDDEHCAIYLVGSLPREYRIAHCPGKTLGIYQPGLGAIVFTYTNHCQ